MHPATRRVGVQMTRRTDAKNRTRACTPAARRGGSLNKDEYTPGSSVTSAMASKRTNSLCLTGSVGRAGRRRGTWRCPAAGEPADVSGRVSSVMIVHESIEQRFVGRRAVRSCGGRYRVRGCRFRRGRPRVAFRRVLRATSFFATARSAAGIGNSGGADQRAKLPGTSSTVGSVRVASGFGSGS